MKRKILALLCAAAFALTACGAEENDVSNTTITGKVVSIDGTSVTVQLGELTQLDETAMPEGSGEQPRKPDDTNTQQPPPDKSMGSGEQPQDGQPGNAPQVFTALDETQTIDLADAAVIEEVMGGAEERAVQDIEKEDIVVIELDQTDSVVSVTIKQMGGDEGGENHADDTDDVPQGTAATLIKQDDIYDGTSYTSNGDDENALRVDNALVTLSNITVNKASGNSSNTENGDFYGQNAALLATDGASVTVSNATVTSSAPNGNGIFSYGEDTMVNVQDSTITTTGDHSGGLQTTGGGTTNASNVTVSTAGRSSAAIRSDRGGGTVDVTGGSYTTKGLDSPAIYSTALITARHAQLTALSSEALVIEGQNAITLEDCVVSGQMHHTDGASSDENVHTVMLYQSMSGDARVGTARFSMTGGSLKGSNGDLFFLTNTACEISLSGVAITNADPEGNLMTVSGNSARHGWGEAGANGAQAAVTVSNQLLEGSIVVDSISSLQLHLTGASTLRGTIHIVENEQDGEAVENNAVVTVDKGSVWSLTGDCTITSLENHGEIQYNGYTITLADGTVLGS